MTIDLIALGWDPSYAAGHRLGADRLPARVARVDRGVCTVLRADGTARASLAGSALVAAAHDPLSLPCAGDWVLTRTWPDGRCTVESVLPRRSLVVRRTAGRAATGQALAANVDVVAVVEPMHPAPDPDRIERLLALAFDSGARPLVVLTKCDLAADPEAVAGQIAQAAPHVAVCAVSAQRGDGLAVLRPLVAAGRTLGLFGPSGSGKSTLVNALAGAVVMPTQRVRRADGKGKHTTTHRALVPVPGGGAVLDTPGLRGVGMLDTGAGVDRTFADITELAAACRFGDCRHEDEPGCAVRAAVDDGDLAPRRWASWQKLRREAAYESRRRGARRDAEHVPSWARRRARRSG